MEQSQVSIYQTVVIGGEADNSGDLAEDVGGIVVHLDIVISERDGDSLEMIVVLKINTMSSSHNPLICDE